MRPSWRVAEVWYARQASEATGESAASGAMETPGYQRRMPGKQLVSEEPAQTYELCLLLTAELEKWECPSLLELEDYTMCEFQLSESELHDF